MFIWAKKLPWIFIYIYDFIFVHNLYLPYRYWKEAWHWSSGAFLHPRSKLVLLFAVRLYTALFFPKDYGEHTSSHISSKLWAFLSGTLPLTVPSSVWSSLSIEKGCLSCLLSYSLWQGSTEPCTSSLYDLVITLFSLPCFFPSVKNFVVLWLTLGYI